jgi:hypothetical protein
VRGHVTEALPTGPRDLCMATIPTGDVGNAGQLYRHLCRIDASHSGEHECSACGYRWVDLVDKMPTYGQPAGSPPPARMPTYGRPEGSPPPAAMPSYDAGRRYGPER